MQAKLAKKIPIVTEKDSKLEYRDYVSKKTAHSNTKPTFYPI